MDREDESGTREEEEEEEEEAKEEQIDPEDLIESDADKVEKIRK